MILLSPIKKTLLSLIILSNLIQISFPYQSTSSTPCKKKYNACFKSRIPNKAAVEYFKNDPNWCVTDLSKNYIQGSINQEFNQYKCTFVDNINLFKGRNLINQNLFLTTQSSAFNTNTLPMVDQGLKSLKEEELALFSSNFPTFTPQNFPNITNFNSFFKQKNQNTNLHKLTLHMFVYMPSSNPFTAFLRPGYLDTQTGEKNQLSYEEFTKYLQKDENFTKNQLNQLEKKINTQITYIVYSQLHNLHEKAKAVYNYEFSIVFDLDSWTPYIMNVRGFNILSQQSSQSKLRSEFLVKYTKEVLRFQAKIIENFANFSSLYKLLKDEKFINAHKSADFLQIINEAQKFILINSEHIKNSSQIFKRKKIACMVNAREKTRWLYHYFATHKKSSWIIIPNDLYKLNIHRCDMILGLFPHTGTLGWEHFDLKSQLWNFTPKVAHMHNKAFFYKMLQKMDKKNIYNNYNSTNFFPETYILNYTSLRYYEEEIKFLNKDETNPYQIWISKPVAASQGKGIQLFNTTDIKHVFQRKKIESILKFQPKNIGSKKNNRASYVVQSYIKNTQLIENKKFDIRCYLLIAWTEPGAQLALYHKGYVRRTMTDYPGDEQHLTAHDLSIADSLTNAAIQQKLDKQGYIGNNTIVSIEELKQYWKHEKGLQDYKIDQAFHDLRKALTYTAHSYFNILDKKPGFFELFGVDIMFDNDYKPYVLEANSSPQMSQNTPHLKQVIPEIIKSAHDLETFLQENRSNAKKLIKEYTQLPVENLQLLINKANGFDYLQEEKTPQNPTMREEL